MKRNVTKKRILLIISALLIIVLGVALVWLSSSYPPTQQALTSLTSTDQVKYTESNLLSFEPTVPNNKVGIIFYPGGKVDAKAYAPLAKDLALKGYTTVIVTMPLNLAVLNINGGDQVIDKYPEIQNWIVSGHSLGGTMVAKYYNQTKNPKIKGLVFLASYPDTADNLSSSNLKVLSLLGTLDNEVNKTQYQNTKPLLPADTKYLSILGGNHSQFGYYGLQSGDNVATISLEDQQTQTVNAIDEFIKAFNF